MTLIEKREEVRITLQGSDEIEIETLTTFLHSTINILKIASEGDISNAGYRKFLVTNVSKGSFIIDLMTVLGSDQTLLGATVSALTAFKTFLDIKKHLIGEKPTDIRYVDNDVLIQNCNNSTITVQKFYFDQMTTQPEIDHNLTKMLNALKRDDNRSGVTFEYPNNENVFSERVEIQASEVEKLTKNIDFGDFLIGVEENEMETNITLRKIDFEGATQWSVYLNGRKENVVVTDEEFLLDVKNGKLTFGTHTVLRVKIRVKYKVDVNKNPIIDEKVTYEVFKVISVFTENVENTSILN